ncbi:MULTISPECIES: DUF6630 family protein [Cupriavidus]
MTIELPSETQDAMRELILLVCLHDRDAAERCWSAFRHALTHAGPRCEGHQLLWPLSEATGTGAGFYVEWNDAAALVRSVQGLAARAGLRVDWGVADPCAPAFLATHDVPALMTIAQASLRAAGHALWCWDTQADAFAGWLVRGSDEARLASVAERLQLMIDPADETC